MSESASPLLASLEVRRVETRQLTLPLTEEGGIHFLPDPWQTGDILVLHLRTRIGLETFLRLAKCKDPVRLLEWALDQNPELPS